MRGKHGVRHFVWRVKAGAAVICQRPPSRLSQRLSVFRRDFSGGGVLNASVLRKFARPRSIRAPLTLLYENIRTV